MNIILISDLHLLWENPIGRIDNLRVEQFKKLEFVLDYAQKNDAIILQAGDFFNRPRLWHLLPAVTQMLRQYQVPIFCVFGQHDTYLYSHDTRASTNLGELEAAGLVHILDDSVYEVEPEENSINPMSVHLYGASHGGTFEPPNDRTAFNILVLHKAIGHTGEEWGSQYNARAFLKKHKGFHLILCGDIHQRFRVKIGPRQIINTGSMLRRVAREYNFHHTPRFFLLRAVQGGYAYNWVDIPCKPSEEVLSRDHIEEPQQQEENLNDFVSGVTNLRARGTNTISIIKKLMNKRGVPAAVKNILTETINADQ